MAHVYIKLLYAMPHSTFAADNGNHLHFTFRDVHFHFYNIYLDNSKGLTIKSLS